MFAFLIWDERERRLFGARDRFGEKPLFYAETPGGLLFASEIKAIVRLMGGTPSVRPGVARAYLQHGTADVGADTFFRGISSLPAGHKLTVENDRLRVERYWDLESTERFRGDPTEAYRALFLDSIRLRTRSDVPLGTCLSGGLDSGAIVCGLPHVMGEASAQVTRKTFTAAYREFDENPYVELVNRESGSTGYSVVPEPSGLSDLAELIRYHDEPFHSFAAWAGYRVMGLARSHGIIVLLNGQGSDEMLAGYPEYLRAYLSSLIGRGRLGRAVSAASAARSLASAGAGGWRVRSVSAWGSGWAGPSANAGRSSREDGRRPVATPWNAACCGRGSSTRQRPTRSPGSSLRPATSSRESCTGRSLAASCRCSSGSKTVTRWPTRWRAASRSWTTAWPSSSSRPTPNIS